MNHHDEDMPSREDDELEAELMRLRPVPVESLVLERMGDELAKPLSWRWKWPLVAGLLAAACAAVFLYPRKDVSPPPAPASPRLVTAADADDRSYSITAYEKATNGSSHALSTLLDRQAIQGHGSGPALPVPNAAGVLSK